MGRKLNDDTKNIIETVNGFISSANPSSLRFIFYRLVSLGLLENKKAHYVKIKNIILTARIRGDVEDDAIVDNKRTTHRPASWAGLDDYMESVRQWYRRNFWIDQPKRVEILVEKATVGEVLKVVAREYNVPLRISSGFYSRPFLSSIADDIADDGKPCAVGYVGDFDPSGFSIERAARQGNGELGTRRREGILDIIEQRHRFDTGRITWTRIGVTDDDFKSLPVKARVPIKKDTVNGNGDPRSVAYEQQYGRYGFEVEALSQDVLQNRVRAFIKANTKIGLWKAAEKKAKQDAAQLAKFCDSVA